MALVQCKECKKEVSDVAKKCPHCGISNPGMTAKKMAKGCLILIVLTFIGGFGLSKCDDKNSDKQAVNQSLEIKDGTPQQYQIIAAEDYSFSGRKRLKIFVTAPSATSFEDRASTIQLAAKEYLHHEKANQVTALLEVSKGMATRGIILASATYTPDGCGNSGDDCIGNAWEVESSSDVLTSKQISISEAWFANRGKFVKKDGLLDEPRLKSFLSKKLNVPLEEVTLPFIYLKPIKN